MELPKNKFKQALRDGRHQIGLWCTLSHAYSAEIVSGSGYDWLLFDTEHSPADIECILGQLQAAAAYDVSAIVRPAANDTVLIKRYLDIGVQSLIVPYVQSAAEAQAAVAAVRYPPDGVRGVSAMTRANKFGRVKDYARRAAEELCLIVQVETRTALDALEAIAAVDGIDGIFIGPGDLAASLGHPGEPNNPAVRAVIEDTLRRIVACGKPAGILTPDAAFAKRAVEAGSRFTAIGIDAAILARSTETLLAQFKASL
jgi:4-hydroxy-2-oxoheptanedioate aldolase